MSRKHLRIVLSEEDAKEFSRRKHISEGYVGTTMTDSAFAAGLIRGRLEDQIPEAKIVIIMSFLRDLANDENVPVGRRIESAELMVAFVNGLEVKRR